MKLPLRTLPHAENLPLPSYATQGAAGLDLMAAIPADSPIILNPMERMLVPTGLEIEIPHGYEGQVRPRSGLALKHGLSILNAPGTIDSDYRGELRVIIVNFGSEPYTINRGDRIAQLVIASVVQAHPERVGDLTSSQRGAGGFGSTGHA